MTHLYRRLAWTFRAELDSFERKRYRSLSHEPNKAMNLNSYIGLMGGCYRDRPTPAGRMLAMAGLDDANLVVPDADYVLTLDADSVILPEYALRMVYLLEQRQHARVGVAQTPYSAFPGAATRIERIAGATTDLQHIVHQGMTFYGASFWVGANAVLRKAALDDVAETDYVGGWPIRRYIRDRTLIEDTESTIDLAAHGWATFNYPERLAYSATPPDFGSLCIQRHRWANGGLLILPKMRRCMRLRRARGEHTSAGELLLRANYMASTFWSSLAVLFLMAFQFEGHLPSPLTFAAAGPYFAAMAYDLAYCGYKPLDILRVYGFNLLLLPVNLAGSLSSIAQGLTGAKGRFRRTPKVRDRTVAGAHLRRPPLPPRRPLGLHLPAGDRSAALGRRRVRGDQRGPLQLRDPRVRRHARLAGRHLDQHRLVAVRADHGANQAPVAALRPGPACPRRAAERLGERAVHRFTRRRPCRPRPERQRASLSATGPRRAKRPHQRVGALTQPRGSLCVNGIVTLPCQ